MKKFIVIDKQEGFSWISDSIEDVFSSTCYSSLDELKDIYEVIEIIGEIKYLN